jgi:beta-fructofuranosidase
MFSRRAFVTGIGAASVLPAAAAVAAGEVSDRARKLAADPLRPQYHLLPKANWMNDPNGPIYVNGLYHLFYQYHDDPIGRKPAEWGHAVSPDMLHWQHWPIALSPVPGAYDYFGIWTGCAVMDGKTPTLIYTAVGKKQQMQCLATSNDGLRTWQKLPQPLIEDPPPGFTTTGFRDPVVWREKDHWSMIVGSGDRAIGPMVFLYRSPDLRRWTYIGQLYVERCEPFATPNGVADGMMWECPDFFPLGGKHVLLTSGRGTRWVIGTYDGTRFHPDRFGLLDHGYSYAPRSMLDKDGNRILWAWITEPRPEAAINEAGWAGIMSLPRQLAIGPDGDLTTRLAPVVDSLRRDYRKTGRDGLPVALAEWRLQGLCGEVRVVARNGFRLTLKLPSGENFTDVAYEPDRDMLVAGPFRPPLRLGPDRRITICVLIDGSVAEVYANDRVCVSVRLYPKQPGPLSVVIDFHDAIESLEMWQYTPISPDRLTS